MISANQILAAIFPDEDSQLLARGVREFGERELIAQLRALGEQEFAGSLLPLVAQRNFLGTSVPSTYGGAGGTLENYLPVIEGIAALDGSLALTVTAHESLAGSHILLGGSEEQKQTYLPKLVSGETLAAWCLTEPNAGSNILNDLQTTLRKTAKGWVLNGEKTFITNGCHADLYVVIANAFDMDGRELGPTTCLVGKMNSEGSISATPLHGKMGMRRSDTASVTFSEVSVASGAILGAVGDTGRVVRNVLLRARVGVAALTLGLARDSLERALRYSKERTIGPDALFQKPLTHGRLLNMLMVWWAAWRGVHCAAQSVDHGKPAKIPSFMVKVFGTETALQVCDEAIQLLGGYGYMTDYKVEQNYRDARLLTIGEGTSEVLQIAIAGTLEKSNYELDALLLPLEAAPGGASLTTSSNARTSESTLDLARDALLLAIEQIKKAEINGGPAFHHQFTEVEIARMTTKLWVARQAVNGASAQEVDAPISKSGGILAREFANLAAIEVSHSAMNLIQAYGQWDDRLEAIQARIRRSVASGGPSEVLFSDLAERILA